MEHMPYQPGLDTHVVSVPVPAASGATAQSDWRNRLPVLSGRGVTLRELRQSDAASLCALLTAEEVTRFISPPPSTVEGFERFIAGGRRHESRRRSRQWTRCAERIVSRGRGDRLHRVAGQQFRRMSYVNRNISRFTERSGLRRRIERVG